MLLLSPRIVERSCILKLLSLSERAPCPWVNKDANKTREVRFPGRMDFVSPILWARGGEAARGMSLKVT